MGYIMKVEQISNIYCKRGKYETALKRKRNKAFRKQGKIQILKCQFVDNQYKTYCGWSD